MNKTLQAFHQQIQDICIRYQVKNLYAFGSVTKAPDFNAINDIDLIVAFNQNIKIEDYADYYFDLADSLEELFGKKVDLMTEKPIKNPFLKASIEKSKIKIYG
jgi:predicted nucleotidyltransferase